MWDMSSQFIDITWDIKWFQDKFSHSTSVLATSRFNFSPEYVNKVIRRGICSALYIVNIHVFSWLKIPCNKTFHTFSGARIRPFRISFICEQQNKSISLVDVQKSLYFFCPDNMVFFLTYCFKFYNQDDAKERWSDSDKHRILDQRIILLDMLLREDYFHVLMTKFFKRNSVLLLLQKHLEHQRNMKHVNLGLAKLSKTTKMPFHEIHNWIYTIVSSNQFEEILFISQVEKRNTHCPKGSFQCDDKSCITLKFLCDEIIHCNGGTDEETIICSHLKSWSVLVYLLKPTGYTPMEKNVTNKENTPLIFHAPCEASDNTLTYPAHKTCVFDRNYQECKGISFSWILQFCKEHQCSNYVKCPESYCVPYRNICDGVYDCPNGEDEYNCTLFNCSGQFDNDAFNFRTEKTFPLFVEFL